MVQEEKDSNFAICSLQVQLRYSKTRLDDCNHALTTSLQRSADLTEDVKESEWQIKCINDAIEQLSKTTLVEGGTDHA